MQTIPNEMRVTATDRFGGPERLSIHMLPVPVPDAREVLIAVDTAAVGYHRNRLLRRDRWRPRVPTSRARRGSGETEGADCGSLCAGGRRSCTPANGRRPRAGKNGLRLI